jgi:hypothetical protein
MKNLFRIVLFSLLCVVGVLVAQDKNQNNTDPTTAKMNKAQKEHLKIYKTYSLTDFTKISRSERKKLFTAFYSPISVWCGQAEKLYEESAAKAKEKMEAAKNPQQKQQLTMLAMVYEQAAKSCQSVKDSFEKNDQLTLDNNIKKYADLENEMNKNRIQHPVRDWITLDEGNNVLMLQRKYMKQMRQVQQQRQPQPQPKRQ